MNRIMLDLETMGNRSNSAIIAIGAVRFNEAEVTEEFHRIVSLESSIDAGLEADASTIMWWMQQSDDARKIFNEDSQDLISALFAFGQWLGEDAEVWGNGAAFDNVILANAYRACGLEPPWKFWNDRCYRTLKSLSMIPFERCGTHHCAVDDARSQALHLIKILEAMK